MSMQVPTNIAAEQVSRLQRENADIGESINALTEKQAANRQMIEALSPLATWEDAPDPIVVPPADPSAAITDALPEGEA